MSCEKLRRNMIDPVQVRLLAVYNTLTIVWKNLSAVLRRMTKFAEIQGEFMIWCRKTL